jgi:hypothetical protein
MADQTATLPEEAGPVEDVGETVALGPALTMLAGAQLGTGLVALAPGDAGQADLVDTHGVDDDDHLDGDLLVGSGWMQPDNLWGNLPEVKIPTMSGSARSSLVPCLVEG